MQWKHHLQREPHRLRDKRLQTTIDLLSTFDLRAKAELKQRRPDRRVLQKRIEGLELYRGYIYVYASKECDFAITRLRAMHNHMPKHGRTASQHQHGIALL